MNQLFNYSANKILTQTCHILTVKVPLTVQSSMSFPPPQVQETIPLSLHNFTFAEWTIYTVRNWDTLLNKATWIAIDCASANNWESLVHHDDWTRGSDCGFLIGLHHLRDHRCLHEHGCKLTLPKHTQYTQHSRSITGLTQRYSNGEHFIN